MIREFLIGLGFKVDDPSKKKFESTITVATKQVKGLGEAVLAAATGIEVAVVRISRQFEALYWVSQRARSSVTNMQAWSSANDTVGISADRSRGAIEGLARAMRLSGGGVQGLLNSLGVRTAGRDTKDILEDFYKALEKYPSFVRAKFAQIAGQNPDDVEDMIRTRPQRERAEADYRRRLVDSGINPDKLAKSSQEFGAKLTVFLQNFDLLLQKITIDFLPLANKVLDFFNAGAEALLRLDKATNGWALTIGTVAIGAIGAWIAKALLLRFVLRGVAAEAGAVAAATAAATGGGAAGAAGGAAAGAAASGGIMSKLLKLGLKFGGVTTFLSTLFAADPTNEGEDEMVARRNAAWAAKQAGGAAGPPGARTTVGMRNNNPGNLRGWGSSPKADGFARFGSASEGASAMAGNLLKYGERGWDTVEKIIQHWAPPNENNTAAYVGTVSGKMGVDPNQRLNLRDPAVLAKIMNAMIEVEQGGNPWGKDLAANAARSRLGGGNVTLTAKTEINIAPGADAQETATRIERAQDRVNRDLARNLAGATR